MLFWVIDSIFERFMKGFLFTGRVAFLLNILFVVCLVLRLVPQLSDGALTAVILIGGWILSVPVNIIWILWLLFLVSKHKKLPDTPALFLWGIPGFLLFQLLYFFF